MYEQLKLDIERLVQQGSFYDIRSKFDHLESSEVAALLEILSREDGARVFRLLRHQRATSIFKYLAISFISLTVFSFTGTPSL